MGEKWKNNKDISTEKKYNSTNKILLSLMKSPENKNVTNINEIKIIKPNSTKKNWFHQEILKL